MPSVERQVSASGRREFTRFTIRGLDASIEAESRRERVSLCGTVLDLSLGGVLVRCAADTVLKTGTRVRLMIHLPSGEVAPLPCRIARSFAAEPGVRHMGLQFLDGAKAHAKRALLSIAMLETSVVELLRDELEKHILLATNRSIGYVELRAFVAKYPPLTSQLVTLAESPLYSWRRVKDVAEALRILGFRQTLDATLAHAVAHVFHDDEVTASSDRAFWMRALTCAHLAEHLRAQLAADPGDVFAPAFLRDLGSMVLRRTFPLELARLEREQPHRAAHALEEQYFALTRADVARMLIEHCSIPRSIAEAMNDHGGLAPSASRAAAVVHVADRLIEQCEASRAVSISPVALGLLRLTEWDCATLRAGLPEITRKAKLWYETLMARASTDQEVTGVHHRVRLRSSHPVLESALARKPGVEKLARHSR